MSVNQLASGMPFAVIWWLSGVIRVCVAGVLFFSAGCSSVAPAVNRGPVDEALRGRIAAGVVSQSKPGEPGLPPGVNTGDGLTDSEAVATALWNNAAFQGTLAELGVAKGDLVQAGLLANPQLNLLFPPVGSKQLEWTLFAPLDAFILRKYRVAVADRDFQRVCEELVQNGLNVARDARVALVDLQLAEDRWRLALENVAVRERLTELAQRRLAAGDTGELELVTARLDTGRSRAEAAGLERAVQIAEARLRLVLGLVSGSGRLQPEGAVKLRPVALDVDGLIAEAVRQRPDVRAARIAVEAAERRLELNSRSFLRVDGVFDGNNGGAGPNNMGPGLRFEVPIFNRNEGLVIRSQWSIDQARHNYQAVHDRAVTEIRVAAAMVEQAGRGLEVLNREVLPDLQEAQQLAELAWADGGNSYVLVLQTMTQVLASRQRELELQADLRRAIAELSRSAGKQVEAAVAAGAGADGSVSASLQTSSAESTPAVPAVVTPEASAVAVPADGWRSSDRREY